MPRSRISIGIVADVSDFTRHVDEAVRSVNNLGVNAQIAGDRFTAGYRNLSDEVENVADAQRAAVRHQLAFRRGLDSIDGGARGLIRRLVSLRAVLLSTFVGGALTVGIRRIVDFNDQIRTQAELVGLSVKQFQEYRFAAVEASIPQRALDIGLQRFARRVGEAAVGTGELVKVFDRLGIEVRDSLGQVRPLQEVLYDYADAIRSAETESEKLALAFKGFDREGARFALILGQGSEGLRQQAIRANELGVVLDELDSNSFDSLIRGFRELGASFQNFASAFIAQFSTEITGVLERLLEGSRALVRNVEALAAAFRILGPAVVAATGAIVLKSNAVATLRKRLPLLRTALTRLSVLLTPGGLFAVGLAAAAGAFLHFRNAGEEARRELDSWIDRARDLGDNYRFIQEDLARLQEQAGINVRAELRRAEASKRGAAAYLESQRLVSEAADIAYQIYIRQRQVEAGEARRDRDREERLRMEAEAREAAAKAALEQAEADRIAAEAQAFADEVAQAIALSHYNQLRARQALIDSARAYEGSIVTLANASERELLILEPIPPLVRDVGDSVIEASRDWTTFARTVESAMRGIVNSIRQGVNTSTALLNTLIDLLISFTRFKIGGGGSISDFFGLGTTNPAAGVTAGATAGVAVTQGLANQQSAPVVNITVQGSVIAQRDLEDGIRAVVQQEFFSDGPIRASLV